MAWQPVERVNESYERYYKLQRVCRDDADFAAMMEALRAPLPAAFRVTFGCDLRETTLRTMTAEREGIEPPRPLAWYPAGLAFGWSELVRKEIRKDPRLQEVKQILIGEAERGAVVRQEAVSMIPPIFMNMDRSCACVDLCAAPGSKTSQLLDLGLADAGDFDRLDCSVPSSCAVIANDVNLTRARMLCHQVQRLGHPGAAVTYMDASAFPKASAASLLFDRVLADVPCSGDGTLRKNVDIWAKWTPRGGLQLHDRQLQILRRGMSLVAPGGLLVYSTCSLNPIEDEAVVAAALAAEMTANGTANWELLPVERDGLTRAEGLTEWVVPNPVAFERPETDTVITFDSLDHFRQVNETLEPKLKAHLVQPTMFSSSVPEEIRQQLPRCGRFLPHHNNSGGFFVAILHNKATEPCLKKPRYDENIKPVNTQCESPERDISVGLEDNLEATPDKDDELQTTQAPVTNVQQPVTDVQQVEKMDAVSVTTENMDAVSSPPPRRQKNRRPDNVEEYFKIQLLTPEDSDAASILRWYGLTESVESSGPVDVDRLVKDSQPLADGRDMSQFRDPRSRIRDFVTDFDQFPLVSKDNKEKRLYLATPRLIHQVVNARAGCRFLQVGVKAFERLDEKFAAGSGCAYRPMGEAVAWLIPYMRRRLVFMSYSVMIKLLESQLSKMEMLTAEKEGTIVSLDPLRRAANDGLTYLEPGGFVAVCTNEVESQICCGESISPRQLGTLRVACLMSLTGNAQPLVRKANKEALLHLMSD